ncbi:MAG: four helix bundle protein [Nitrospirae bacterium]|nr:four helix bundle protein [Nitrospirota bacterium]
MNKEELIERTKKFALDVFDVIDLLPKNNKGQVLGRQLLKAATSVGANYRAACRARSKAEFISKLGIVVEESDECIYWLELIKDCKMLNTEMLNTLITEAHELTAIFVTTINSTKRNSKKLTVSSDSQNHKSEIINLK